MKIGTPRFLLSIFLFLSFGAVHAQVKIGDNPTVVHPSAVFEVESKTKGVLIPRLTAAQRIAIAGADTGLIVYQTDDKPGFYFYNGKKWETIRGGNAELPDTDGDGITDQFDLEPNTPSGAQVDAHGVARDTDGDGVPDYMDKELLTPQSCFPVDADGFGHCPADSALWLKNKNDLYNANTGNVGIGTATPSSKLQVNGDLMLQKGASINEISKDSTFIADSHQMVPTEKAIKDYLKNGTFIGGMGGIVGGNSITTADTTTQNLAHPNSIAVQGTYAYVVGSNNLLSIYDISNPNAIVARGTISKNLFNPQSIAVQGNYAYVASYDSSRLSIYDISNPDHIVAKGVTRKNLLRSYGLAVQGNYVYVASFLNNRLCVYDVSNPDKIVAKGFTNKYLSNPFAVTVQGKYAYVASYNNSKLCVFDISNPDSIVAKSSIEKNLYYPRSVAVQGNYAYVASQINNRLCIYDISNPDSLIAKGFTTQNLSSPCSVSVTGRYAYVTSFGNNQLSIFDVSNPDKISPKAFTSQNLSFPYAVDTRGNYAYVISMNNNTLSAFNYQLAPAIPVFNGDSLTYSNILTGYATTQNLSNYVSLTGDQTISGRKTFDNNVTVNGTLTATTITESSDIRFKQHILPLQNALSSILQLNGVSWLWKTDEYQYKQFSKQKQIGFVAQDVEKVVPEVVATDAQGYKSIDYAKLTAVLTEAVKAQEKKIEMLEKKVTELINKNKK